MTSELKPLIVILESHLLKGTLWKTIVSGDVCRKTAAKCKGAWRSHDLRIERVSSEVEEEGGVGGGKRLFSLLNAEPMEQALNPERKNPSYLQHTA